MEFEALRRLERLSHYGLAEQVRKLLHVDGLFIIIRNGFRKDNNSVFNLDKLGSNGA